MAGSIGPIAAGVAPPPSIRRDASRTTEPAPVTNPIVRRPDTSGAEVLSEERGASVGTGGSPTLSGPGAALVTISRNVEAARELVPSLIDIRTQIRTNNAELREVKSAEVREQFSEAARAIVRTTPDAAPRLDRFFESDPSGPVAATGPTATATAVPTTEATETTVAVQTTEPTETSAPAPDVSLTTDTPEVTLIEPDLQAPEAASVDTTETSRPDPLPEPSAPPASSVSSAPGESVSLDLLA